MVDLNSTRLPPGENFGIVSDNEDLEEHDELNNENTSGNFIVVDRLPVVPEEKIVKLKGVIQRIIHRRILRVRSEYMPIDPVTEKTRGCYFVECCNAQEAKAVKLKLDGYKLDKLHTLAVYLLDEIDMQVPDDWACPVTRSYTAGENLQQWLTDEKARDQFVIRAGSDTEVFRNDARHLKPDLVFKKTCWSTSYVQWSPLGTYLATLDFQGAAVWGGATDFNLLMRFVHPKVKLIDFSPGERFLVTYSDYGPHNPQDIHGVVLRIFDVRTGKLMRCFEGNSDEFGIRGAGGVTGVSWPVFRWGGGKDDKYVARIGKNLISVYETETFRLIDKKSMKVENVMDISWSPTDPILAIFVPEHGGGNQPARVSLVQIPSKEEVRQKNLFSVSDCKMYWQSNGDYLAVMVDKYTKTKESTYTGFELFRIKEGDIPIEVLELENKKDKVIAFAWEPKGHRFAVIHGDNDSTRWPDVSFYSMRTNHNNLGKVSKLTTLKCTLADALYWSPAGRFIVLAELKGLIGHLVFYDVDELETMATAEHITATVIEWDPTGRYVATAVTRFSTHGYGAKAFTCLHEMENGFNIWSFNGELLYRILKDRFFQFLWRPRPPPEKKVETEDQDGM